MDIKRKNLEYFFVTIYRHHLKIGISLLYANWIFLHREPCIGVNGTDKIWKYLR